MTTSPREMLFLYSKKLIFSFQELQAVQIGSKVD